MAIFDDKAADKLHESYKKHGFLLALLIVVALLMAGFTADPYFVLVAASGAVFLLVAASRDLAASMYRALNFIFGERETTITPFITLPTIAVAAVCAASGRMGPPRIRLSKRVRRRCGGDGGFPSPRPCLACARARAASTIQVVAPCRCADGVSGSSCLAAGWCGVRRALRGV